ncbi:hypothetical protein [Paenibacillus qinlingensis]|uniref:Uncharacterized protein n=1 Tax=Paenibacillus qinlingensis TaxID=1837343 RepID=A0ABU1NXK1_9BACL|nr:hypothetical protein [Paenibacillus qinlingensis]MDR6552234.1 hypothetical protein [Paenibacillus qinlingensis]
MEEQRISFADVKTNSVYNRTNLVTIKNMADPFADPLPDWQISKRMQEQFDALIESIVLARAAGRPVIWSMGAHVIKNGLSRYIIEMVRAGILTHVSGNGATSIHDFELAFLGETSEDVARSIEDGSFGMWEETGRYMNEAIQQGASLGLGYGESLYRYLARQPEQFPYFDDCLFAQCQVLGVPYTCHISIGTDIIHQHPIVDFEALGRTSGIDFHNMCESVAGLEHGGIFLNFGSAISGPEIFLKALSICRNAGLDMVDITAANFDILPVYADIQPTEEESEYYYRPRRNFMDRLGQIGGAGYLFNGLHQMTIPHLFHSIMKRKQELGISFPPIMRNRAAKLMPERLKLHNIQHRVNRLRIEDLPALDSNSYEACQTVPDEVEFHDFIGRWTEARAKKSGVLVSLGGNVIGSGVNRYLIDLLENGWITHLAVNGACAFQDFELAAFGGTEEADDGELAAGRFGMWREPGEYLHEALRLGYAQGLGYGRSLIAYVQLHPERFPYLEASLLGACMRLDIPYTVHITIGTDAVQQHPTANFSIQGKASGLDFQSYTYAVSQLEDGVFANFGSTVTGPEVFLKALSISRNLGYPLEKITTANFDIVKLGDYHRKVGYEDWDYYYRPRKNIIHRPTSLGGKGFHFEGLHQAMIPAIWSKLAAK